MSRHKGSSATKGQRAWNGRSASVAGQSTHRCQQCQRKTNGPLCIQHRTFVARTAGVSVRDAKATTSWWLQLDRADFQARVQKETLRMNHGSGMNYSPKEHAE
jgi:hypothetical protein